MAQNYIKCNIFFLFFLFSFQNFEHFFEIYIRIENLKQPNCKKQSIETKYLNNTQKNIFWKVKNSLLELENHFIGLKEGELKHGDLKYKRNRRLFFKPIIVTIDNMDRFEQKETKKRDACKKNWRWF